MRLVRNTTLDGKCKYALVRLDKIRLNETGEQFSTDCDPAAIQDALDLLHREGLLEYGEKGSEEEFFAIKLKDLAAPSALLAYSMSISRVDGGLAGDVAELANRSANIQGKKQPD